MNNDYQYQTSWRTIFIIFAIFIAAMLLFSCYSPKKAEKQVSKALAYYPEQTIGKVRILAPCVTLGHSFTTDSAAYKESLDSLYNTRGWYEQLIRGLESLPPHPTTEDTLCPAMAKEIVQLRQAKEWSEQYIIDLTRQYENIKPVIINRVDTIEDLAKVQEMDFKLLAQQKMYREQTEELSKVKQERDKAKAASSKKTWWMVGEGLLALLLGVGLYFILKAKATTKLI